VYFGAQMREAGDYPYTKALSDPSFMAESHFNPARSPIAHHWRMLARNVREHARGRWPRLTPAAAGARAGSSVSRGRRRRGSRSACPTESRRFLTGGHSTSPASFER